MAERSVLVVDDSAEMLAALERYLGDHGWRVHTATGAGEALRLFAREAIDVVLTDLRMEGSDGIDVLEEIQRADPITPIILMTAFGTVESAVDAIQRGAHHYITKPFRMGAVRAVLEGALEQRRVAEGKRPPRASGDALAARGIVGGSPGMRELARTVGRVSRMSSPVLILGETGTGKELVARAIHAESERADSAFVAVSCAALHDGMLEGELRDAADGGTLFLDEVADLPLALQGKLLRVIESGELTGAGDGDAGLVDVRFIAATNRDLTALVRAKAFREDLFYRLEVIPLRVPPLRERREDVPLLVEHFLSRLRTNGDSGVRLTPEAQRVLEGYSWPGNVRELASIVKRLVVMTNGHEIDAAAARAALTPVVPGDPADVMAAARFSLQDVTDRYVEAVLRQTAGDKVQAATILGVDVSTLYRRARRRRL